MDTGRAPETADVDSVEALLAVPWIAGWAHDDLVMTAGSATPTIRPFFRWSVADNDTLIAEFAHGDHWYVVAYLTSDAPVPLPAWTITPTAHARLDRWNRGDTRET